MTVALFLVALVVGAMDPLLWIASIIAAFFSKGRWWVVPLAALIWGAVLEFALMPQLDGGYTGEQAGMRLASALLNGFIVLGIASLIRKFRKPAEPATADQSPTTEA